MWFHVKIGQTVEERKEQVRELICEGTIKLFPSAKQIIEADLTSLKTTITRKETLKEFSRAVHNGSISLESTQEVEAFLKNALSIKGIGPWTANYMALKAIRHTDAFPESDLILARALKSHPKEVIEPMRPWRGYVAALFWRAYAESLKKTATPKINKTRREEGRLYEKPQTKNR